EALLWYIEGYGSMRKPLRIPFSKEEIIYCNTMLFLPGCRFQISRAHYFHLIKHRPEFAPASILNDESAYRNEIYRWVSEIVVDLNAADVLVPDDYINYLKQIRSPWKDRKFAFNDYFEIRRHNESSWHVFSADSAVERGLMYLVAWLETGGNPGCLQYMPENVRAELFETKGSEGLTFFEEYALDLLEDVSLDVVRALYDSIIESQGELLLTAGFDVEQLTYSTCDKNGNRRHFPYKALCQKVQDPCDLQVIGPFGSASGLGQATRLSVLAMREAGLDPHLVNFDLDNPAPTGFSTAMKSGEPRQARVNLVHLNAEAAPFAAAYLPDIFSNSYNIGYFFWELDTPAKCHSLALQMFDEVWVSTEYGVQQYSAKFDNPVVNVGMTFEEIDTPSKQECRKRLNEKFSIDEDETVFLATFDSFSFVQRKNPKAVIRSFLKAFPKGDERVRLIIKTQNRHSVLDPNQQKIWKSIDHLISLDSRIQFVNKTMTYTDLLWFKKAADCYVSLHRSEGWGFGMIESMMLEVPVIATGYSGNLEFCKDEHCWLVDTDEIYLEHDDYIFVVPGQKWGEPKISHAAECMKNAHLDENIRLKKARIAREFVQDKFSPCAIGERYANRLKSIYKRTGSSSTVAKVA
nr:glycosyltransferase [Acidiferrobacterales bacterium]